MRRNGLCALDNIGNSTEAHIIGELYHNYLNDKGVLKFWKQFSKKMMTEFSFVPSRLQFAILFGNVVLEYRPARMFEPNRHSIINTSSKLLELLNESDNENLLIESHKKNPDGREGRFKHYFASLRSDLEYLKSLAEYSKNLPQPLTEKSINSDRLEAAVSVIHQWWQKWAKGPYTINSHRDGSVKKDPATNKKSHKGAKDPLVLTSPAGRFSYILILAADRITRHRRDLDDAPEGTLVHFHEPDFSPTVVDDVIARAIRRKMETMQKNSLPKA